jgi:hypothetical protein
MLTNLAEAKWLGSEERDFAVWRLAEEAAGKDDGEDGKSIWNGAMEAVKDVKTYALILIQFSLLTGMAYVS